MLNIILLIVSLATGALLSAKVLKGKNLINFKKFEEDSENLLLESKKEAEKIRQDNNVYVQNKKHSIEQYVEKKEQRIQKIQESLNKKELNLNKREDRLQEMSSTVLSLGEETESLKLSTKNVDKKIIDKLSSIVDVSPEVLIEEILKNEAEKLESENMERLSKREEVLKENSEKIARRIVVDVIQRLTSETSVERRAVNIKVPRDIIKGKIVGKDAQNIKALEEKLDVDIVFNDLPNTISVSAFNLVQRRLAETTLEKLVKERGEITPEVVIKKLEEATKDVDNELYKIGKKALNRMGIEHNNEEFIRTVGRLKYRTSYGQNIMMHSMEVGWLCRMLGNEIGLSDRTCLVAGFLHDVGKAIDQDPNVKDCHDLLSKEIMEKHGFNWEEVHAAWVHHDAEPQQTPEALLVKAADAISAARPGARQESFEKYLERIKDLEHLAVSYNGVKRAFAISAGREVRVLVDSDKVLDENVLKLSAQMAEQIEEEITYPGQIKVNVIRRTKHTEIAR